MRAKQSTTASGMYSRTGTFTPDLPLSILAAARDRNERNLPGYSAPRGVGALDLRGIEPAGGGWISPMPLRREGIHPSSSSDTDPVGDEGLSHDAQNLLGAVSLYCDLLSAPGVLKPEHRHYAEELRIIGTRSSALVVRLMLPSPARGLQSRESAGEGKRAHPISWAAKSALADAAGAALTSAKPVTLRTIVTRCSGMLGQVAGGRAIEVSYGAAASMPVLVSEETVERILVNLVRNAAAALEERAAPRGGRAGGLPAVGRIATDSVTLRETSDGTDDETPGAIRIGVGQLVNRVGDPRPWPFRRVRLTVEDSGCGMTPEQLERVLFAGGEPLRGGRGIGLRVVRELVALSGGQLRAMSAPGVGTRCRAAPPGGGRRRAAAQGMLRDRRRAWALSALGGQRARGIGGC
jgi:signal transduction histidine kinase